MALYLPLLHNFMHILHGLKFNILMNRYLAICFLSFITATVFGQSNEQMIQGVSPDLHLQHTVAAKETWYSISRLYNISPKEVAPFNGLTIEKPLAIGQVVKIPLTAANFSQDGNKAGDEVLVPLYHTVQEKEWMYRISVNHNKVPIEKLELWNQVNKDQVKAGMRLVVGFLKVKPGQSALASKGSATVPVTKAVVTTTATTATTAPVAAAKTADQKTVPPTQDKKTEPVTTAASPVKTEPVVTATSPGAVKNNVDFKGGYFKSQFENGDKSTQGFGNIFRSNSGWQDGKYYALMNNVPVGTIIKVNANSKSVYAKVLGNLADIKENGGLALRISDAAAAELGIADTKFTAEVKY